MTLDDGTPARGDSDELVVRLPFDGGAARLARARVDDLLAVHAAGQGLRQDAALVVHELVMNAVRHGRPDPEQQIELSSRLDQGLLMISVRDWGSRGRVAPKPPSPDAPDGRGLAIVAALCATWAVDRSTGTTVSAWLSR